MGFGRAILLLASCLTLAVHAAPAKRQLQAKHAKSSVACYDCHQEETPTKGLANDEPCMQCHGDLPAMEAYSRNLKVNPHAVREDREHPIYMCVECHHQHQPPEVKCLECHKDFKLTAK